jgi:hypothetical protein
VRGGGAVVLAAGIPAGAHHPAPSPASFFFLGLLLLLLTHAGANCHEVKREAAAGLPPYRYGNVCIQRLFFSDTRRNLLETVLRLFSSQIRA